MLFSCCSCKNIFCLQLLINFTTITLHVMLYVNVLFHLARRKEVRKRCSAYSVVNSVSRMKWWLLKIQSAAFFASWLSFHHCLLLRSKLWKKRVNCTPMRKGLCSFFFLIMFFSFFLFDQARFGSIKYERNFQDQGAKLIKKTKKPKHNWMGSLDRLRRCCENENNLLDKRKIL